MAEFDDWWDAFEAQDNGGPAPSAPRLPVMQGGRRIGTVAPGFHPRGIKSEHWLYEPRPTDFTRDADGWVADRMMGPGDFDAIPGFVWDREEQPDAEQADLAEQDMLLHGIGIVDGAGNRVDPRDFYVQPPEETDDGRDAPAAPDAPPAADV